MAGGVIQWAEGGAALRKLIASGLKTELGRNWIIFPALPPVNAITKPTIVFQRQSLIKTPEAPQAYFTGTYALIVISNKSVAETSEDYLDSLLDPVLEALEDLGFPWQTADRQVWNDTNPAYKVTLTALSKRNRSTES